MEAETRADPDKLKSEGDSSQAEADLSAAPSSLGVLVPPPPEVSFAELDSQEPMAEASLQGEEASSAESDESSGSEENPVQGEEPPVQSEEPPVQGEEPPVQGELVEPWAPSGPSFDSAQDDREEEAPAPSPEPRRRSHVAPAHIAIERILEDETFRVRPEGDLSALATDLARLGQLFPVDVRLQAPDKFQIICGFRRVAALRFLQRDRVLARLHTDLSDEDALLMALASVIHAAPVSREELMALRDQLESQGRLDVAARDMLEKALIVGDPLAPEGVEEEVDADELAVDVAQRLGSLNQDLSLLADVFAALDESRKAELLMQLRYSAELVTYLEGL